MSKISEAIHELGDAVKLDLDNTPAKPVLNALDGEDALNNQSASADAAANPGLNATDGKDAAVIQGASTPESAPPTMYNIDGEPGVDAADVKEEDKKFKYKDLGEVNAERQTKEMDPLPELKSGGRRRSRRRNYKKSAKKSAKRGGGRKSAKKGGKKHRKSAKKGGKKRSYRKH
jgi:hypothetical protein